jgi:DNA-binding CsgD family transcriptional regulator
MTMLSAGCAPVELGGDQISVVLPENIVAPHRRQVEQIIHRFLFNIVRHGYSKVQLTLTACASLANPQKFTALGALDSRAPDASQECAGRLPPNRVEGAHDCSGRSAIAARTWRYSVDALDGARSQVVLGSGSHAAPGPGDIHSHAALIGFCHILHNDICAAIVQAPSSSCAPSLTAREIDSLKWTAEGKTAAEIAQIVGISRRTVESYISSAMRKLGASTRSAAAVRAYGLGLLKQPRLTEGNSNWMPNPAAQLRVDSLT